MNLRLWLVFAKFEHDMAALAFAEFRFVDAVVRTRRAQLLTDLALERPRQLALPPART